MHRQFASHAVRAVVLSLVCGALACVLSPVSWSPDGRWIALINFRDEEKKGDGKDEPATTELWIVSPSAAERHRLFVPQDGSSLSGPAWSADGKRLYVVAVNDEANSKSATLWEVNTDGKRRRVIQTAATGDTAGAILSAPAVAPDGRRIAFVRDEEGVVIANTDGQLERVMQADEPSRVLWLADGRWLGVVSDGKGESPSVVFFDTQTSESYVLDPRFRSIAPLPGSKRIVALKSQSDEKGERFYVSLLEATAPVREATSFALDFDPFGPPLPSPRGDSVFLARAGDGDEGLLAAIFRLDLQTGGTTALYESFSPLCVAWSVAPDGHALAFREALPGKDGGEASFVGVLDLVGTSAPVYLIVEDKQWAAIIDAYTGEMENLSPDKIKEHERALVPPCLVRVERFLALFRHDFPQSPLVGKCEEALKEARASLEKAGFDLRPDAGKPLW